jgi:hypothetical protein
MTQFNVDLLKKFIAPALDERPEVNLPDLSVEFEQAESWFAQYFLSSIFQGEFTGQTKVFAESYIARSYFVFNGYKSARIRTIEYAEKWRIGAPGINRYLSAVAEWEMVFLNLQILYDILAKWFEARISGREDRTRQIGNRIKHVSEDILEGNLTESGVPLWLTRTGFATRKVEMTFKEMEGQVRVVAKIAECLSAPSQAKQKFSALDASLVGDLNYVVTK